MTFHTFDDQMRRADGHPSGFDYLRITLAVAVVVWHTILVLYGRDAETPYLVGPLRPVIFFILPGFFALSGFLVAGSLERNDLPSFLTLRALRIYPALIVEVVVSALLIGGALTTLPMAAYFTDPLLYQYALNVTGWIHYTLPGLFLDNPSGRQVNAQLWTVPYELECYIAIAAISLIGLVRRPIVFLALLAALSIGQSLFTGVIGGGIALDHVPSGRLLVLCFLMGVALYGVRTRVPHNALLAAIAAVALAAAVSWPPATYLSALPVAYLTVFLGLLNPRRVSIIRSADYSYGIYLYGFAIQQAVAHVFPTLRVWWFHLPVSLAITGLCAYLSWNLVEKHVVNRKKVALTAVSGLIARFAAAD